MRLCGLILLSAAIALWGCGRAELTVDDVIDRNTTAVGGRAAIEAIQSIEVDLHITDPGFEADGVYYAARPGKMRIDVSAGGKHVFTEAFDGQRGWEWARRETNERGIGVNRPYLIRVNWCLFVVEFDLARRR